MSIYMKISKLQNLKAEYVERNKRRISDLKPTIEKLVESSQLHSTEIRFSLDKLFKKIEFWKLQIIKELKALESIARETWSWTFKIDDIEHLWVRIQACLDQAFKLLGLENESSQRILAIAKTPSFD